MSTSLTDSSRVVGHVEELLLALAESSQHWPGMYQESAAHLVDQLMTDLGTVRREMEAQSFELAQVTARSNALAEAQADALVHSAEIIDELEQTRLNLSDARAIAEKNAQNVQRLADTVFERTNDGVLVLEGEVCTACNENSLRLLDTTRDQILGQWPQAFDQAILDGEKSARELLRTACQKSNLDEARSIELILRRESTEEFPFWVEITLSAFNMNDTDCVLAVVRDITSRKKFEAELRQQRDFLEHIINAVPDQVAVSLPDQGLVMANRAFCQAHEISPARLEDLNEDQFHQVDQQLMGIDAEQMSEELTETTDYEVFHKDQRSVFSVKRSLFEDETSGNRYLVSTARDVTDVRAREDRLRLLASVFEGASEGVAILSPGGQIREANPAFRAMSLVSNELEGRLFSDVLEFPDIDLGDVLARVSTGDSWSGKAVQRVKNLTRWYWVSLNRPPEFEKQSARIIALVSDITELENTQAQLKKQALFDNLTGLPNRRFFRNHLTRLIEDSKLSGAGCTVAFLDLDDFKHVNDTAGHAVGDCLLVSVGKRIQEIVGAFALVARFGGDEFAIVFPDQSPTGQILKSLRRVLTEFRKPFCLRGTESVVGVSIGVTIFPEDGCDADSLMCNADIAMYAAKSAGKNQLRNFTPELQEQVNTRHKVQTRLRRALNQGEIHLLYQPKIYSQGTPAGCEALVRWRTAENEYVPPSEFIPIAEQTGLILPLGELVFHHAAMQACEWHSQGMTPSIAVNISPMELRHPRFVDQLLETLEETGAQAEWFELEITEHAIMDDVEHAIQTIQKLDSLGFRIAVDDFGTGYSSLSYLKHFRIHTLKIDMSFVQDITTSMESRAIVQSIVSLGNGLSMQTVAEGVESREQLEAIQEVGCQILQGYYISKPVPAEDYVHWLNEWVLADN